MERKSFFYANYFNWSLTSPVILNTHTNHAIWQKLWSTSIVLTVVLWILQVNASKEEKRRKTTTKSFCKVWALKLAESDNCSYYNQEKWLKDNKASEKPIESTAKSGFTSFLASGVSFLGREVAKWATNLRQVPRHIKIGRRTFLKVYCSRRSRVASRKTPGSSLLSIFPGKCWTFRKCIE